MENREENVDVDDDDEEEKAEERLTEESDEFTLIFDRSAQFVDVGRSRFFTRT